MRLINEKYFVIYKIFIITVLLFNFIELYNSTRRNIFIINEKKESNYSSYKELGEELIEMQKYVDIIFNGTLIDNNTYTKTNPKISVVITVYNGEGYLKTAILSIQNQDLKDLEIVIIDDCSKDNSVHLIKEFMKNEPRISFYKNNENKGMLYTKTKGAIMAKGKYVMIMDEDDIYSQRDAFSILYNEAEKNKLDLLGFKYTIQTPQISPINYTRNKIESPIIYQPELSEKLYPRDSEGKIWQRAGNLVNYLIRKDLLLKAIKQIDEKYLNFRMNYHDDFLIFFLLTRNAYNCKMIDRIFYIVLRGWNQTNPLIKYRNIQKIKDNENIKCSAFLNFLEFILKMTKNTVYDKKIAVYNLNRYYLSHKCRNNSANFIKAKKVLSLYLENEYIENNDKISIQKYLKEIQ